jgi:alkaline phosphatase
MKPFYYTLLFLPLMMFLGWIAPSPGDRTQPQKHAALMAPTEWPINGKKPKNIILMIGDGMGLTQITAGMYSNRNFTNLERCTASGLSKVQSANDLITDSAAGATAFSCGCKTNNGVLGLTKDLKRCQTILEKAHEHGLSTGLVVSCSLTHATPAAFVAHVQSRADMESIATFFPTAKVDLLIGGGLKYFSGRITDQRNIFSELRDAGYELATYKEQPLSALHPAADKPFAWFSAWEEPESVEKGRTYLPLAAHIAPPFLKKRSDKGFFMMLEGSQIDWGCHNNDAKGTIAEMLDFDKAIGEILDFAKADGETLVVVTADHETGGMAIKEGSNLDSLEIAFTTKKHTASLVPIFAFGPGAELFNGVHDNTDIYRSMEALFGFAPPLDKPIK